MQPKLRRERQKLFGFMYKRKPKIRVQPLLGKTGKIDRFFALNGRLLSESGTSNKTVIHELLGSESKRMIAKGTLTEIGKGELAGYLPKKTAEIGYGIEKKYRNGKYRNRGIATSIVKSLLAKAKANGYEKITVTVMPRNKASMRVISKLGFENSRFVITHGREKGAQVWYKFI